VGTGGHVAGTGVGVGVGHCNLQRLHEDPAGFTTPQGQLVGIGGHVVSTLIFRFRP
jgi:hypothetical protein